MEKSPEISHVENQDHDLNRRELLKVLAAAGGGLAAAAFLPGKWLKPVVEAGVLPAHAQATDTVRITRLGVYRIENGAQRSGSCELENFGGSANYQDDFCKVGVESTQFVGSCPTLSSWSVSSPSGSCSGYLYFNFMACCNSVLSVHLNVGSRQSATETCDIPCGETA